MLARFSPRADITGPKPDLGEEIESSQTIDRCQAEKLTESDPQQRERRIGPESGPGPHPTGQDPGVDATEVHRVNQVSGRGQLARRQSRMAPVKSRGHTLSDDEHGIRGAVIGTEGLILRQAASELAEDHDEHMLVPASAGQAVQEGRDRSGKHGEEAGMDSPGRIPGNDLEGMGIEAAQGGVEDPDSRIGRNDAGDDRQICGKIPVRHLHSKFGQAWAVRSALLLRRSYPSRMPDLSGPKMASIRIGIPHPLNQSHLSRVEQPLEPVQGGMESDGMVQLQDVRGWNGQIRTLTVVILQAVRDHRVEAVATSSQLDEHQHWPRMDAPRR